MNAIAKKINLHLSFNLFSGRVRSNLIVLCAITLVGA